MGGREARGRASRAALIDAAVAVIGAHGVEAVTHRALAARAGLSVGLVTYHFATRDALLAATYVTLSAGNADEIAALARDVIDRGEPIDEVLTQAPSGAALGGVKVVTRSGWFAARPSGTEDVYKLYAESFEGPEHLERILEEAQQVVDAALGA